MNPFLFWALIAVGVYFAIGVLLLFFFLQTPYSMNPLWMLVLLWPLFLLG